MKDNKIVFNQNTSREALITLAQIKFGVNTSPRQKFMLPKHTNDNTCNIALNILVGESYHPSRILSKVIYSLSLYQYIIGNISEDEMLSIINRFRYVDRMYWTDRNDYSRMISLT